MSERTSRVDHAELSGAPAIRFDAGRLGKVERTPTGGVRIPATLARTGVLTYLNPDGTTRREYRPAEEVFHQDALRSFDDAAVTMGHPPSGKVTPATHRRDSVGHVRGEGRREGSLVAGTLAVTDGEAIQRVDSGELVEISAGYDVLFDPTPGVAPDGERYDGVQRQIRVNHVALLPRGGGRSGREVALRIDSAAAIAVELDETPAPTAPIQTTRTDAMKTQRIDGFDYVIGSPEWELACQRRDQRLAKEHEDLEKRAKDAEAAVATQTARADTAEKRVKELEAELDPARLDARVAARTALVEKVRPVLGADTKLDGKSEDEIKRLVVEKLDPDAKARIDALSEGQRAGYIAARFDGEIRHATKSLSPLEQTRRDALPLPPIGAPQHQPARAGMLGVVDAMRAMEQQQKT